MIATIILGNEIRLEVTGGAKEISELLHTLPNISSPTLAPAITYPWWPTGTFVYQPKVTGNNGAAYEGNGHSGSPCNAG